MIDKEIIDRLVPCYKSEGYFADCIEGEIYSNKPKNGIYSKNAKRIFRKLKPKNTRGYLGVTFSIDGKPKQLYVHRVIWEAYHQEAIPEGMVVDHIIPDKKLNKITNLQLLTPADNVRKACCGKPSWCKGLKGVLKAWNKGLELPKGFKHSEESKKKMSEALKKSWARRKALMKIGK